MTVPCRIGRSVSSTVRHPHQKMSLLQQLFHFLSTRCQEIARTFAQAGKNPHTHTHFKYIVKAVHVPAHACNTHLIKLQQVNMISLSGAQHAVCVAMYCLWSSCSLWFVWQIESKCKDTVITFPEIAVNFEKEGKIKKPSQRGLETGMKRTTVTWIVMTSWNYQTYRVESSRELPWASN